MMRGLAALLLLGAGVALPAAQEAPAPAAPRSWFENFSYRVEIDGAASPQARLFSTQGRPALLLMAPELNRPAIVQISGREVLRAEAASVTAGPAPTQVVLADSDIKGPPDPYTRQGEAVIFFSDGHKVRIFPRPPLVGPASTDEVLQQLPSYRMGMAEYAPSPSDLFYLKNYKLDVKLEVFFGSWCPHCRVMVPMLMKALADAANPKIAVEFHGVPAPPFSDYGPAKENRIDGVPTFIVFAEGQEVGRFSTVPGGGRVENELVKVLFAYEKSKGS